MIKALPDIIPDDSIHDAVTQDVGKQILKTIKDHVFIARVFLHKKIFNPVSVLEKTSQMMDFEPFEFLRIRENFINALKMLS